MTYDELLMEADASGLITKEKFLLSADGRIFGNRIAIRKSIPTLAEKACVLAEELGHYHTTVGDITDLKKPDSRKQELKARMWAYNHQIGLLGIVKAYKSGCRNRFEVSEFLGITESFLNEALDAYRKKYGMCTKIDNYVIYFEPYIGVMEIV